MLSSNKLKENLLQRKDKKRNDLLANQRRPYESCYMTLYGAWHRQRRMWRDKNMTRELCRKPSLCGMERERVTKNYGAEGRRTRDHSVLARLFSPHPLERLPLRLVENLALYFKGR